MFGEGSKWLRRSFIINEEHYSTGVNYFLGWFKKLGDQNANKIAEAVVDLQRKLNNFWGPALNYVQKCSIG